MAIDTTTKTETYNLRIVLNNDGNVSPFTVGKAVAAALATLPDEPFGYSFDPYWNEADAADSEITLPLFDQGFAPREDEHVAIGTAFLTQPRA